MAFYDTADAIYSILEAHFSGKKLPEVLNIGSGNVLENIQVLDVICMELGKDLNKSVEFVQDRPGHDFAYALSSKLIHDTLGWEPKINFRDGIKEILKEHFEVKK